MSNTVSPREHHHITATEFPISFHMKERQSEESSWTYLFSRKAPHFTHVQNLEPTPSYQETCGEVVFRCNLLPDTLFFCVCFFVQVQPFVRNPSSGTEMSHNVYPVRYANSTRKLHHVTHVSIFDQSSDYNWSE